MKTPKLQKIIEELKEKFESRNCPVNCIDESLKSFLTQSLITPIFPNN